MKTADPSLRSEPSPVPLTPLDEALLLVLQKSERRTVALANRDQWLADHEQRNLWLAVADYHQILRESVRELQEKESAA